LLDITSANWGIFFRRWQSSQSADQLRLRIKDQNGGLITTLSAGGGVVQNRSTAVSYPANLSSVGALYAVGASTDWDYRADYSAFGSTLDFVAPAAGGFASRNSFFWDVDGILTTDRSGADGYVQGGEGVDLDYTVIWGETTPVGGTSMSAAIASGVAALVLSKNANQFATLVGGTRIASTCDKVGPVAYTGSSPYDRNNYYGYGRIDADAAVDGTPADSYSPQFSSITVVDRRTVDVVFTEPMGEGAFDPANYEITAGENTLSDHPDHVVRLGLKSGGYSVANSVYRLVWDSGDIADSGTVTIAIASASAIKDVAGNSLTGTLSRSGTGTTRQIGVDCGSGDEFRHKAPFRTDNKFQGNEAAPAYLTSGSSYIEADYGTSVDTSGLTDPAPQVVYQSRRVISSPYEGQTITYEFSGMPSSGNKVRVHITNVSTQYQYEVFDIYVNGTFKERHYGGGTAPKAYIKEYTGIGLNGNSKIEVKIVPVQSGYDNYYHASISGIEVMQP
jgi:hypothetical protein